MGRMKELLDKRLEENKYEMYDVIKELLKEPNDGGSDVWERVRNLKAKIEKL